MAQMSLSISTVSPVIAGSHCYMYKQNMENDEGSEIIGSNISHV